MITGRHQDTLDDALKQAETETPGKIQGRIVDHARHEENVELFKEMDEALGPLDFLINNAGLSGESVTDSDFAAWRYVVDVNLVGYMDCCQLAYHRMKDRGGHILNIGSTSAEEKDGGGDVYVATKSALQGFSTSLQRLLGKENIKVTLLEPGWTGSDMTLKEGGVEEQRENQKEGTMMCAEDIAAGVVFALSQPRATVSLLRIEERNYEG